MKSLAKWVGVAAATILLTGPVAAADAISAGTIKSVNAEKKTFVLTDATTKKDVNYALGENVVVNRGGKESPSDVNAGDKVNVCYEKGTFTWTARYILVQVDATKNFELAHGTVKSYDAAKKQFTFTGVDEKDFMFPVGEATIHMNSKAIKAGDAKIGDQALLIVEKIEDKTTLKCVILERS